MSQDLETRVERLFLPERPLFSRDNQIFRIKETVYLCGDGGKCYAVLENGKRLELVQNLNFYEIEFKGYFLRVHRSYLVAMARIAGVYERYPEADAGTPEPPSPRDKGGAEDECELGLSGTDDRIPVTVTYARDLKKAMGVSSLDHLVPEHPLDKALRLYELIDFGWRELYVLDPKDAPAVEAFRKKWDIRQFTRERMLSYFRQFGVNEINKKRVIKNIIYQMFRWIKKGIEPPSDGNIRSLWYRIKAVLAYHSDVLGPGDVDTFYNTLQEMVEDQNLFRYKDFGFMDMNEPYRGIGAKSPEIILASEKLGHYLFIKKLAAEAGVSFICMKGEPAVISLEYFSDDLMQTCGDKPKTVFCISDVDPAGYSIEGNLVAGLQRNGHQVARVVKLVDTSIFTSEEIAIVRYPVVNFETKGDQVKPIEPATMGQVTKGRAWWNLLKDDRLISEKDKGDGWKSVTIWGIESDAADREIIRKRFQDGLGSSPSKPGKGRR
ncbi:MAG: LytTR family transcriptional regulator [Candidatus Riflebacteria bacterium]|nr:LytTR family transcriptional regulator [Candidatus Riflebacteria bacterium]